ncbi:hypothetical protein PLESTB_001661300 [Pleodorina starrii]|uniref:Uncharacterized protein n=1 Tax=Pleodorina starrii TaxID=330485 RepID=A0A9W6BYR4_9CHLO|nr:hypothetical protein PLESTB_001661300 [Pleodorina starrii]GLC70310.1 hypothetical protein PLESTF_000957800 [Pleodorina starrii]
MRAALAAAEAGRVRGAAGGAVDADTRARGLAGAGEDETGAPAALPRVAEGEPAGPTPAAGARDPAPERVASLAGAGGPVEGAAPPGMASLEAGQQADDSEGNHPHPGARRPRTGTPDAAGPGADPAGREQPPRQAAPPAGYPAGLGGSPGVLSPLRQRRRPNTPALGPTHGQRPPSRLMGAASGTQPPARAVSGGGRASGARRRRPAVTAAVNSVAAPIDRPLGCHPASWGPSRHCAPPSTPPHWRRWRPSSVEAAQQASWRVVGQQRERRPTTQRYPTPSPRRREPRPLLRSAAALSPAGRRRPEEITEYAAGCDADIRTVAQKVSAFLGGTSLAQVVLDELRPGRPGLDGAQNSWLQAAAGLLRESAIYEKPMTAEMWREGFGPQVGCLQRIGDALELAERQLSKTHLAAAYNARGGGRGSGGARANQADDAPRQQAPRGGFRGGGGGAQAAGGGGGAGAVHRGGQTQAALEALQKELAQRNLPKSRCVPTSGRCSGSRGESSRASA